MVHYPCAQGGEEWLRHRMGRPTASAFDKIITSKKWEPTKGETRMDFKVYLLTELILDMPLSGVTVAAMEHGHEWEEKARASYEMLAGVDVEPCGFCTTDDGTVGASPDGFVGEDGSLEIKSPFKPEIHCGYMVNPQSLSDEYWTQTQGQLYVTGRKWTDLVSYFSGMPMVTIRVTPHAEFQAKLDVALRSFVCEFSELVALAKGKGWIKERQPEADHTRDWITDADVEALLARQRGEHGNSTSAAQ